MRRKRRFDGGTAGDLDAPRMQVERPPRRRRISRRPGSARRGWRNGRAAGASARCAARARARRRARRHRPIGLGDVAARRARQLPPACPLAHASAPAGGALARAVSSGNPECRIHEAYAWPESRPTDLLGTAGVVDDDAPLQDDPPCAGPVPFARLSLAGSPRGRQLSQWPRARLARAGEDAGAPRGSARRKRASRRRAAPPGYPGIPGSPLSRAPARPASRKSRNCEPAGLPGRNGEAVDRPGRLPYHALRSPDGGGRRRWISGSSG